MEKELRPYQRSITDKILDTDRDSIVVLPTGAGKTFTMKAIMDELPGKCIFIVPRLELIGQASSEFGDVDIIWSDKTEISGKKITVASKDSLRTQIQKLTIGADEHVTLIFDEAHIGIKQTYALVEKFRKKYPDLRVLGLTATPERMDGLALLKGKSPQHKYGVFDDVMQEETVSSLIRKGYLANLRYYVKPIEGITNIRPDNSNGEELSGDQMMKIMNENGIWGDLIGCYEKYGLGRPAIGFTVTIEMAEMICNIFRNAGYDFRVIHGEMKVPERKELIDALACGKINGLVNAALLTYGFDCPKVSYAFSVRHMKSRPLWFQTVGRILRTAEGKPDAIFIDHGDSISEFAEPANPLPILAPVMDWRANGETKEQKQMRKKEAKKAQDTIKLIQDYAPLPVDMVELTTENIHERLVTAMMKMLTEKESLRREIESMKKEAELLRVSNERLRQEYETQLERTTKIIEEKDEKLHQQRIEIREKEEELKLNQKHEDSNKTFEYVKKNYCRIRRQMEYKYPNRDAKYHHMMTQNEIIDAQDRLDFYFNQATLRSGFDYWWGHYKSDWKPPVSDETNAQEDEIHKINATDNERDSTHTATPPARPNDDFEIPWD